ncbi:MAG: hypothetical protein KJ720_06735 [Proteobacteria bacterium]|nr:hypothetical protein [Pseudomonadota bacterium]MBU1450625.1 hypothetical protein [Pseudomonadota bacterium]MBU2469204.1 hypothetical protein [Pseudomonadota bacterium]MBU2518706.1 hypothetical protein [Pseudomonadota bacterium]
MAEHTSEPNVKLDIGQSSSPKPAPPGPSRWPWLLALAVILAAVAALYVYWGDISPQSATQLKPSPATPQKAGQDQKAGVPSPSRHGEVIKVDGSQQGEQDQRKKPFGLDKSVDAVARSDESIQVGQKKVPVEELERKLVVEQRGEVREKSLQGQKVSAWGVHVVRPGENLWGIHYHLLREYLAGRGVQLPARADQPQPKGYSTGVGKILKFAEHMVGVYNLRTGHMSKNLNLLEPGQKVVVFNLSEIFAQLDKVNPHEINGIMYDGRVLFFPKPEQRDVTTKEMAPPGKTPSQSSSLPEKK